MVQTGILKSKERTTITKPVLYMTVPEFIATMELMRAMLKPELNKIKAGSMSHHELSQNWNAKINRRIVKYFDEAMSSHDLRKIYASIAYKRYADKDKQSESAYLSCILGHAKNSLTVSMAYSTVSVVEGVGLPDALRDEHKQDEVVPRNVNVRDGKTLERLMNSIRVMRIKDIPVTSNNLRGLGFGATVVSGYLKGLKQ